MDETKTIRIIVDASRAVDGSRSATRALEQIERQTGSMAQSMDRAMGSLRQVAGIFGAGFSARAIIDAADAFTKFNNSLQVAGVTAGNLSTVQDRLFAAANRNGVEIGALSTLYSRAAIAGADLGATQEKLLRFTDGVTAALRLQGGSTEQASGALLQLSQAMGGGIVRAEEFNSILEGAFPIAQAAARGIDGMNGSVSRLRNAVVEGKVTSAAFFEGLLKGFTETEKQAAAMNLTVGAATTVLQNGFVRLVGEVDKASGATGGLAKVMADLGKTMDALSQDRKGIEEFLEPFTDFAKSTGREVDLIVEGFGKLESWIKRGVVQDWTRGVLESFAEGIARWNGYLVEAFRGLPDFLGGVFTAAMNAAIGAVEAGVNKMLAVLGPLVRRIPGMEGVGSSVNLGRLTGGTNFDQYRANILAGGTAAASAVRETQQAERDGREALQALSGLGGIQARGAARSPDFSPPAAGSGGGGGAGGGKGSGGGAEKSYDKLIEQLTAAAAAQDRMTAAAIRGDVAFQEQTIHAQAVEKAIGLFSKALDDTDPRLRKLEELIGRATFGKLAESFAKATNELQSQNEVLEAQNRLMNEAPEIQAREIALLKVKQEVQKAGGAITDEEIARRRQAIEQNETLKLQGEQMKNAAALWSEPVVQAFRNIQTAGADAWETILETGNISFKSLGEVFTKTLRRMAAEFLALATIRPVMTMAIEAIGPGGLGLIGGNTMAQLGVTGGGAGGGGLGSILGGGGVGSIFGSGGASGGGWLARQFSGIGDFLGSPVSSLFGASATPAGGFSNVGSLLASGQTGASAAATGGLSIGGALGGIGSIGMGAYGLLSGKGGTASTIGSIGQIAGGVMMMVPGLQPFGAALSLLSGIIPGLFGGGEPPIPPQPALVYGAGAFRPGAGGFGYSGDALGSGSPMNAQAQSIGTSLLSSFRAAGLTVVPSALIGGTIASGVDHTLQGRQWQDRPYTQVGLVLPGGGNEQLTYNDASRNVDQATEYLIAQAFKANVLRGGVSGAGVGLRTGLEKIDPTTSADLDRVVSLGTAYDRLGKAINPAKESLDQISASFDDLKDFATEAGLALEPINEELKKQSARSAQDFIDSMLDPLAVAQRALADERESALESARYIRDNFRDVHVDMDRIATYYTNKEAALRDQFYQGAVTNLQATIDRLTYGDLANASPTLQLSGTRAAYNAALAQARAGDATAISNLSGYAESYLTVARQSFASSPEYQALVEQIRAALQEVQISVTGGGATTASTVPAQQTAAGQQIAQLTTMVQDLVAQLQEERRSNAELRDLMQRIATSRAA